MKSEFERMATLFSDFFSDLQISFIEFEKNNQLEEDENANYEYEKNKLNFRFEFNQRI